MVDNMIERPLTDDISSVLEGALSRPPSAVGLRLLPEENLADVFNVSRWQIRKSIDMLVQKGFLVRRKGSGTYVRKIPDYREEFKSRLFLAPVPPKDLFSDLSKYRTERYQPTRDQKQLYLEMWTDLTWTNRSHQLIMNNIVDYASKSNHRITIHSLAEGRNQYSSVEKIRKTIQGNCCDGYVVFDADQGHFIEALGNVHTPCVFFGGSKLIHPQPFIILDVFEAIRRALNIFYQEGFQRIAMVGTIYQNDISRIYNQEIRTLNLKYQRVITTDLGLGDMMQAFSTLVSEATMPEAVYIADENLLECAQQVLVSKNIIPGKDIAIITQSTKDIPLSKGFEWSCMEFDLQVFGHMIIENLLNMIQRADARSVNNALLANWLPGTTHHISK
jgi:DNA-binding LacI/PurR family transcriptional regulator/biotin operon repressor